MNKLEKFIFVSAFIIASGCIHAAISHYYYHKMIHELFGDIDPVESIEVPVKKSIIVIETQDELKNILTKNQEPSVIFFNMDGCGWCNKMKPTYAETTENKEFSKIMFYSANGPQLQAQEILQECMGVQVTGYPLFIFMNKGKLIAQQIGGAALDVFEHKIKSMFPEIFGVIAPLVQPQPAPDIPMGKLITMIDSQDELKNVLTKKQEPSVIFFYMNGCGWCNNMKPVLDTISKNPTCANIKFYSVNGPKLNVQNIVKEIIDQNVTGYPLFVFMNKGKCINTQVGGANPENFENKVKATFNL